MCLSYLFFLSSIWAQNLVNAIDSSQAEINRIRFVAKFPPEKGVVQEGIFDRIGEFLFGKQQEPVLSKPISIIASNPESYWVLDQGLGVLLNIKDNVGEIPRSFKKKYSSLVGLCVSADSVCFYTDSRLNKIFELNVGKDEMTEFKPSTELFQPTGLAYSRINDELWVVETAAHRISVFNREGKLIRQIGKRGELPGEFNYPTFIWIDKAGVVYIVDSMNFRIQILNSDGGVITVFGEIGDATGYFSRPKGIATDSFGNIYVVDALFHAVQIFDKNGNLLYHFGKQGREDGQFWLPTGIFIDDNDYIYVADSYNSRVQVFQLINGQTNDSIKD
ncbi:MAG: 6-bladed beta-propeller [Bacteroidales bacterium]|nr:6-bladed beta-propeller [Bacteroidales bacterium]